ncbi:hypothetical protein [Coraliomargarita akajimensis]|uniref:Uncharacterized protein n=1 Tax=Coraliomargarita akajimensis (strain DSM 45221 / IAM 15411 / JCM 23193 / KCTC 12865 / 04OKA010-24) TaxID=583355 RepID=D5EKY8_CORAD|nr:hypothetical protein [Coraliomargarita akajimensis]ADE53090.1 conserved hypothetical protein [Coraliomargarita akajimensis DSM 45221]
MTGQLQLPELTQTELDPETFHSLFTDLASCTEILAVIPKAGPGYVAPKTISLTEGQHLLISEQVRGLQIRYRYQGDEWWDTLISDGSSIRLTRIKQAFQSEFN